MCSPAYLLSIHHPSSAPMVANGATTWTISIQTTHGSLSPHASDHGTHTIPPHAPSFFGFIALFWAQHRDKHPWLHSCRIVRGPEKQHRISTRSCQQDGNFACLCVSGFCACLAPSGSLSLTQTLHIIRQCSRVYQLVSCSASLVF